MSETHARANGYRPLPEPSVPGGGAGGLSAGTEPPVDEARRAADSMPHVRSDGEGGGHRGPHGPTGDAFAAADEISLITALTICTWTMLFSLASIGAIAWALEGRFWPEATFAAVAALALGKGLLRRVDGL